VIAIPVGELDALLKLRDESMAALGSVRSPRGSLKLRGRVWWLRYHHHGRRFEESSGSTSRARAEGLLMDRLSSLPPPRAKHARPIPDLLYAIQAGEGGPIKIGVTTSMKARLKALQTGNAIALVVIGVIESPSAPQLERGIHRRLKSERWIGEWFKPSERTLLVLRQHELIDWD